VVAVDRYLQCQFTEINQAPRVLEKHKQSFWVVMWLGALGDEVQLGGGKKRIAKEMAKVNDASKSFIKAFCASREAEGT
jgi:hypothetical protein